MGPPSSTTVNLYAHFTPGVTRHAAERKEAILADWVCGPDVGRRANERPYAVSPEGLFTLRLVVGAKGVEPSLSKWR